uniref:Amidohydrolase-related domain-containing protein n=1 Tax=Plectus sambesii TaxID=2011161 RepID=A0A914WXV4_9BILA
MSDFRGCVLEADLTWTGECFESDVQIRCDKDGRITEVGQDIAQKSDKLVRLPDQALLPGFVSAHSHAFHRGMRGSSHIGTDNAANSFWCWRQDMFQTVETMTANALFDVCRQTFSEMLAAGITTVGDFHYFHHGENKYEFDKVMLKAAKSAGIRIVLLETYYKQAGLLQQELAPAQTRFVSTSLNEFWHNFAELQNGLEPTQTLGIAAHSIRAVPTEDIKALWQEAKRRAIPFHMHMEEQPLEIKDALDALGTTPTDFVLQHLAPNELFTSVHATYTPNDKLTHLFTTGA